jgi:uncharacterized NAD(P)/FAD-binding protein YdhS
MKKEKKIVTKTKKSFFTPEEKVEVLNMIHQNYMNVNNLIVNINENYNRDFLYMAYLHHQLSAILKQYDVSTLFLKEQKTLNENTDKAFLLFSATN